MSDPYKTPPALREIDPPENVGKVKWLPEFLRLAVGLFVMLGLNAIRLFLTWRAYYTDGTQQIGFPFTFYEYGGFSPRENWYFDMLVIDFFVSIIGTIWIASLLRKHSRLWSISVRKLQKRG